MSQAVLARSGARGREPRNHKRFIDCFTDSVLQVAAPICVAQLSYVLHFRWFGLLRSQFVIYWISGDLWDLEKFCGRLGPETAQKGHKSGFSRSWGPFWAKHPPTKFDRMLNVDPVNPVWAPMCPWDPIYGRFGGGWRLFRHLGTGFVGSGPNR